MGRLQKTEGAMARSLERDSLLMLTWVLATPFDLSVWLNFG
jgi:hypothetical protein